MSVADTVLGPVVWPVPSPYWPLVGRFLRWSYCRRHKHKLYYFFLATVHSDPNLSAAEKEWFCAWLKSIDWGDLLGTFRDEAGWQRSAENESEPIKATLKRRYGMLFYGFQQSHRKSTAEMAS
jgi:hypothetical protein